MAVGGAGGCIPPGSHPRWRQRGWEEWVDLGHTFQAEPAGVLRVAGQAEKRETLLPYSLTPPRGLAREPRLWAVGPATQAVRAELWSHRCPKPLKVPCGSWGRRQRQGRSTHQGPDCKSTSPCFKANALPVPSISIALSRSL